MLDMLQHRAPRTKGPCRMDRMPVFQNSPIQMPPPIKSPSLFAWFLSLFFLFSVPDLPHHVQRLLRHGCCRYYTRCSSSPSCCCCCTRCPCRDRQRHLCGPVC